MSGVKRFALLDGLRGLAALCVGMLHSSQLYETSYTFPHASLAVDFFFCLSGFVIAYSYDSRIGISMSTLQFMVRRFIRLYPMIFLAVLVGGSVMISHSVVTGAKPLSEAVLLTMSSLFLVPLGLFYGLQAFPPDNPVWSLFFEFIAKLWYGIMGADKGSAKMGLRLLFLAVGLIAAVHHAGRVGLLGLDGIANFCLGFFRVGYPFLMGIVILRHRFYLVSSPPWLGLLIAGALASLLLNHAWPGVALYDVVCVFAILPLIVLASATVLIQGRAEWLCEWLGSISYPFYVLHWPAILLLRSVFKRIHLLGHVEYLWPYPALTVVIFLTVFLTKVYEGPVRSYLSERLLGIG